MAAELRTTLAGLKAYAPEAQQGIALDANENPLPPPEQWQRRAALALAGTACNRYPDPLASGLRRRLAALHGLPEQALLFGNGSDELIPLLLSAFGGTDALCLTATPTFSMYRLCALAQGWRVAELELGQDWDLTPAFVKEARRLRPRLIILASPNNPTGKALNPDLVDALRGLDGCTLVMDEAYVEFGGRSLLRASASEPGLVVLRTFSKAWGLAGLRLGWLAAEPKLIGELEKVRLPYNVNALTQALVCEALDMAPAFLGRLPDLAQWKERLRAALARVEGLEQWPSDANFILFRHPEAVALRAHLLARGLRPRAFGGGRLESCLRLSVGDGEQTQLLEDALADFVPVGRRA
ncbi:MAG: pyridoxal phosphate-dependent aminotransferase [bacterium]